MIVYSISMHNQQWFLANESTVHAHMYAYIYIHYFSFLAASITESFSSVEGVDLDMQHPTVWKSLCNLNQHEQQLDVIYRDILTDCKRTSGRESCMVWGYKND